MRILITGGSGFIGTNLIAHLLSKGNEIFNLSLHPPLNAAFRNFWEAGDILDGECLLAKFTMFQPDSVIHLAARADCDENTTVESGYRANTDGTANVLRAIQKTPSVRRVIITSSQFVCGPGRLPEHDEDYFPCTIYGQSKVATEQLTRRAGLNCTWTIVRPTNIWGPWHLRYEKEFWRIAKCGLYFHPGGRPVVRCYGYVGNVVDQMLKILNFPSSSVNARTLYLGDAADEDYKLEIAFSRNIKKKTARRVPRPLLSTAGLAGDLLSRITLKPFYINSSRYQSMITDYTTPMEPTFELLGPPPISLQQGVEETVAWLQNSTEHPESRPLSI